MQVFLLRQRKYISWQWVLTSCGSTVGALIAYGANVDQTEAVGVSVCSPFGKRDNFRY
jgi:hypothetical protein